MSFDYNGTSHSMTGAFSPIVASPWSIHAYFNLDTLAASSFHNIVSIYDASVTNAIRLVIDEANANQLSLWIFDGSYKTIGCGGNAGHTGSWISISAVFNSSTSYSVFKNGAGKATGTTAVSVTHANLNRIAIGSDGFTPGAWFDGKIGHVSFWSGTALTDQNIADLAAGAPPWAFAGLSYYYPFINNTPNAYVGANNLTNNSAVFSGLNPKVWWPRPIALNGA